MNKSRFTAILLCAILLLSLTAFSAFAADSDRNADIISEQEIPSVGEKNDIPEKTDIYIEDDSEDNSENSLLKVKAISAAAAIGAVCIAGAVSMMMSINSASKNIARQPEASGDIRSNVMLGLVFIETAIIYALIVAILIIFVL